ncbi:MAG: TadE/TadG family type IV pilus assembly protein, partial [Anaerolineales bacterium]
MITELFQSRKNPEHAAPRAGRRRTRGQTMVEFALVLPALLLLIFGIIEFARIFYSWLIVTNAARTGERYAVTGSYMEDHCTFDTGPYGPNGKVCKDEDEVDPIDGHEYRSDEED